MSVAAGSGRVDSDVIVVGGGPAGAVAATVLARAGVRVRILERATVPRDKLCGDTVNPGTLARLRGLALAPGLERAGLRIAGMRVTGANGASIVGQYPRGLYGIACRRRLFDWLLLQDAMRAGAVLEDGVAVCDAVRADRHGAAGVGGVEVSGRGTKLRLTARVVIAADGRRSTLAFGLGLARHPATPRRWAIGAYFASVDRPDGLGEMHIRPGRYLGVAPLPDGLTNVCLVQPWRARDAGFCDPGVLLARAIAEEATLRDRFAEASPIGRPVVLGPLAVDPTGRALDGLILTGDAAGFVDPMTGDGLRFAIRGGELAAEAALDALGNGWSGVHARHARARRREFAGKWRLNRGLRALASSPISLRGAGSAARWCPAAVRVLIRRAGDCDRLCGCAG